MNKKEIRKIALTGGPCGGKTSAIPRIRSHFETLGYRVLVVSELATDLIMGGVSPTTCGKNTDYQEIQITLQIEKELAYERAAATMAPSRILILCDRGVMDNLAYMTREEFSQILGGLGYGEQQILNSYDAVFHMETAASSGAYTLENNRARTESAEEAILLDERLQSAWQGHRNFHVIHHADSFEAKLASLLTAMEEGLLPQPPAMPQERQRVVLAIGRWMPIHKGHKHFLVDLAQRFDKLVVGIGSCYENGTARNCIPAVEREILLRRIFRHEGIPDEKLVFLPISDRETFEEWINDVIEICERHHVTHFCTGNKEEIWNVLEEKNIHLGLQMIDPEENSAVSYHATDVRNAILSGDTEKLAEMIPEEVLDIVISQVKREILAANSGQGRKFIPGKQTADVILIDRDVHGEYAVLLGTRCAYKKDFPGFLALPGSGIFAYESALDAALRILRLETGIHCRTLDRISLTIPIRVENGLGITGEMRFVNIFSSPDTAVNGTMGGASQCFVILLDNARARLTPLLYSRHDLEELAFLPLSALPEAELAYEQKAMIYEALDILSIPCPEERFDIVREDGSLTGKKLSRRAAHRVGALHCAAHVCIYRKREGHIEILLQKRSADKDSFPNAYDLASAGHVESGSDFTETALKELFEELGIRAQASALHEILQIRISHVSRFHDEIFHNEELCKVFAMEYDIHPSECILQESEVSSVCWFDLSYVTARIAAKDPLFCTDVAEFMKIAEALEKFISD